MSPSVKALPRAGCWVHEAGMPRCFVPTILSTSFFTAPWKYCKPHRCYCVFFISFVPQEGGCFQESPSLLFILKAICKTICLTLLSGENFKMTLSRALRAGEDGRMKGEGLMLLKNSTYVQKKLFMQSYLKYLHRRHRIFHLCKLFQFIICAISNILHVRFQVLEGVDVGFDSFRFFFLFFFYMNNHLRNIKYIHSTLQS